MNSGLYAACAGLVTRTEALDTIASNMANSSSAGFRGQANVFATVLAAAKHHRLGAMNRVTNSYGVLSGQRQDETQGVLTRTGNALDLAIQGTGYFKVKTATGVAYTRNGAFQTSRTGQLVTARGETVLGEAGPITLPAGQVAVSEDGTVSVGGAIAGRIKVVSFAPGTHMQHQGLGNYAASETAEQPVVSVSVQEGALEGSNVSPVEGMVQLITAQRAAESMRHVLSMLDGEMDKTAANDLSKVSG